MSTNIDTNIVQMKFDNEQFEKKCAQSMSTLDKLKAKIHESTSGNALSHLGDSANSINLSHLEKSVDAVANRFTFLGNLAFKIKDKIADAFLGLAKTIATTVPSIIKNGGWERAMNIEKAKFQLEGLHVAWEQIYDDIDYAVSGTAYGLDSAAKAASQLVASGVEVGDSMKAALRAISGVAAMTQAQYEEISPIFTTVAGQGKLMTMQLRQLESRGLNAAAILAQSMNTTEAAIRGMVSKGEIDFETFSRAMDDAFGEHAKDANRTFEGVTANIRAALKKIGADFSTPIVEQDGPVVKALQQLRLRINDIRTALGPAKDAWIDFINVYGRYAEHLLRNLDMSFVKDVVAGLVNLFHSLLSVVRPIGYAFKDIFAANGMQNIQAIARSFSEFTEKLKLSREEMEDVRATVRGMLSVFDILATVLKQFIGAIKGIKPESVNLRAEFLKITGTLGDMITYFSMFIKKVDIITPTLNTLKMILEGLATVLIFAGYKVYEFINYVSKLEGTKRVLNGVKDALYLVIGAFALLVTKIRDVVIAVKSGNLESLGLVGDIVIFIRDGIYGLVDAISQLGFVQSILDGIGKAFNKFREAADGLFGRKGKDGVADQVEGMTKTIEDAEVPLRDFANVIGDDLNPELRNTEKVVGGATSALEEFIDKIPVARIVAVAVAGALFLSLYRISSALTDLGKGVKNVGSFLITFQRTGIMGLLGGTGAYARTPNHILDIAIAIGVLAGSIIALSKVNVKKLKETLEIVGQLATGYVGILFVMSVLEKWLGFSGALDTIGISMIEISGSIAILAGAFAILSNIEFKNLVETQKVMGGLVVTMVALTAIIGKLGIIFDGAGLTFIGLATSMLILVAALDSLNKAAPITADNILQIVGKLASLGVLAAEMVGIAKLCDMLGGKSFMRLATSALMLSLSVRIIYGIMNYLPDDFMDKLVNTIKNFAAGAKEIAVKALEIGRDVAQFAIAMAGIVIVFTAIWKGTGAILDKIKDITENVGKIRKHQDDHKKALNTLAFAANIIAIGVVAGMLGGLVVLLTKANLTANKEAFAAAMGAMVYIFAALTGAIVAINLTAKAAKGAGAAALGMVLALAAILASTIGVAFYIYSIFTESGSWQEIAATIAVSVAGLVTVLGIFWFVANQISKLKDVHFDKSTSNGIIAMVASIGVVVGAIILLEREMTDGWVFAKMLTSLVLLGAALEGFVYLIKQLSTIPQYSFKPSTARVIQSMALAVVAIAGSLTVLSKYGGSAGRMITAFVALTGTFAAFVALTKVMNDVKWEDKTFKAMGLIVTEIISITASLGTLTYLMEGKEKTMIAAMVALDGIFAAFAGMNIALTKFKFNPTHFKAMKAIVAEIVAVAASLGVLTMLLQGKESTMMSVVGSLLGIFAGFATINALLSFTKFKASYFKAVNGIVIEVVAIAAALGGLAYFVDDSNKIIEAAKAMSLVMSVFGGMSLLLGMMDAGSFTDMLGIAVAAVAVGFSLSLLKDFDGDNIIKAAGAMAIVMGTFAGISALLGLLSDSLIGMVTMIGISASALLIAKSLSMVAQYDWESIHQAMIAMIAVMTASSVIAVILGALIAVAAPGAVALALIGAATIPFAVGLTIAAQAFTVFSAALIPLLPVAEQFITGVLMVVTSLVPVLPATALGLIEFAAGLTAVGAAGLVLSLGSAGLFSAGIALPILVAAVKEMTLIDFGTLSSGLAGFIVPLLEFGAVSAVIGAVSPLLVAASTSIILFSTAIATLNAVLGPNLNKNLEVFTEKADDAKEWGGDLVANFISGIKSKFGDLGKVMSSMAQIVRDYIHFTSPDKGPLSDADSYGGDFVDTFCNGIAGASPELESSIGSMASMIENGITGIDLTSVGKAIGIDFGNGAISGLLSKLGEFKTVRNMFGWMPGSTLGKKESDSATDAAKMKKEQLAVAKAAKEAASAEKEYATETGGAGKASKEAKEEVKDLANMFKEVEKGAKVSLHAMINNLGENYKATVTWASDVRKMVDAGWDKSITDWVQKMGVSGHETVKAFLSATEDQIPMLNSAVKKMLTLDDDAKKYIEGDYAEFANQIGDVLSGTIGTWDGAFAKTVQDALNPFAEFDKKTDLASETLLTNMKSQLEGIREWGGMLNNLIAKGVEEGIIDHFKELGPASYNELHAMSEMTQEQLEEVNEIWRQQTGIGVEIAGGVNHQMNLIGLGAVEGFTDGIEEKSEEAKETMKGLAEQAIEGMKEGMDSHSPSRKMNLEGVNAILGFVGGLRKNYDRILSEVRRIGNGTIDTFEIYFCESQGSTLGEAMCTGMVNGLQKGSNAVTEMARSVAQAAYEAAKQALDSNSPSKKFEQLGKWSDEGMAIGIDKNSDTVLSAVSSLGSSTVDKMAEVISDISNNLNGEFEDLSPVITPRLDLSELQNGKDYVNGMFGGTSYQLANDIVSSQLQGSVNSNPEEAGSQVVNNQNFIFNQTNNSPKTLDAYTIYRQSRNLLNQVKGATT